MSLEPLDLVVTGSVAAVKTFLLADALRAEGFLPRVTVTDAARPFLRGSDKYPARPEMLDATRSSPAGFTLVAPASADFISQMARGGGIADADGPVLVAPAMNVMMWLHPAVQANVRALIARGVHILGPASGGMACGDTGFGRMAEPAAIAAAARAIRDGLCNPLPAAGLVAAPLLPRFAPGPCRNILLAGGTAAHAAQLTSQGYAVRCVAEPGIPHADLHAVTGHPAVTDHYQIFADGMEHIRLPESADAVVIHATKVRAAELAQGAAHSLTGCIYLATKRPVVLVPAPDCAAGDLAALAAHGTYRAAPDGVPALLSALGGAACNGISVLVLGGSPRETVDSFRFYVNAARDKGHGRRMAEILTARGARARLVETDGTARDLVAACRALRDAPFDLILQLANIAQFACPAPSAGKISKTGGDRARLFAVEGNIDILAELKGLFGANAVMGYSTHQEWTDAAGHDAIAALARATA